MSITKQISTQVDKLVIDLNGHVPKQPCPFGCPNCTELYAYILPMFKCHKCGNKYASYCSHCLMLEAQNRKIDHINQFYADLKTKPWYTQMWFYLRKGHL